MADPGDENIAWEVTEADMEGEDVGLLAWIGVGETPQEKAFARAKSARDGRSGGLSI